MYQIERAIIMAAGTGTRMRPLTNQIPKPLIPVNGTAMLETVIAGLCENNITEIYIVVGYRKEQIYSFCERCAEKYPINVQIIENPFYDQANNISSLYVAREHLENAIILEGDQIIRDSSILSREFEHSEYNAYWVSCGEVDWNAVVDTNDRIVDCIYHSHAESGWEQYGVSRWTAEDGKRLRRCLEKEFIEKQHRDIYWDDVALFTYKSEFELYIRRTNPDARIEIDSVEELCEADPSYKSILCE